MKYKSDITNNTPVKGSSHSDIAKREHLFYPIIVEAADKHNVDPALVKAIIMAESGYNPMAISEKGAIGLMQVMPATADDLGVEDLFNPRHNVNAGVIAVKKTVKINRRIKNIPIIFFILFTSLI